MKTERIVLPPAFTVLDQKQRLKIWLTQSLRDMRSFWRDFRVHGMGMFALVVLAIFFLFALIHPILIQHTWPKSVYDPTTGYDIDIYPHPSGISWKHWLGTDALGRDVLSMLMAATLPSLEVAFTAALFAALIGLLVGALSAYFRGWVDTLLSGLSDMCMIAPAPILMVVIGFVLDISPIEFGLIYGFLAGAGSVAVVLRAQGLKIMNMTYIQAAKVAGGSSMHIIFKHLIPHLLPLAAVNMLLTVTGAIFANGFIAFLGLSRAQLNWGSMIYDSFTYLQINSAITWNVLVPSALAISLFAGSFYFLGVALQEVISPKEV